MILDDAFANGKAEARAVRLAVRGKGIEQMVGDLRRNALPDVLDFRDNLLLGGLEPQDDLAAFRHGIRRIVQQVVEGAAQAFRVNED